MEPTEVKDAYLHSGDLTIQSPWQVTAGESYVVFVDGNLNIEDPSGGGKLITVDEGGFLACIVSGDIKIDESVGHSTLSNTAGNIEGVYDADGTIRIMSNGEMDKRFIGEGTFVGWTDMEMLRDFNDEDINGTYPTETFIYRPDFVRYTPEKMKRAQMLWQETN